MPLTNIIPFGWGTMFHTHKKQKLNAACIETMNSEMYHKENITSKSLNTNHPIALLPNSWAHTPCIS
jgi:hypothetical protein